MIGQAHLTFTCDSNRRIAFERASEGITDNFALKGLCHTLRICIAESYVCALQPAFDALKRFALRCKVSMKLLAFLYD